jgi:hypothetical protein
MIEPDGKPPITAYYVEYELDNVLLPLARCIDSGDKTAAKAHIQRLWDLHKRLKEERSRCQDVFVPAEKPPVAPISWAAVAALFILSVLCPLALGACYWMVK